MASGPSTDNTQSRGNGSQESLCQLDIGGQVFVVAKLWRGNILIHIRKYDTEKGRTFPTERGVTLQLRQWNHLRANTQHVDESVVTIKQGKEVRLFKLFTHLGANLRVCVDHKFPGVDIRQWWWCDESESTKPSKKKGMFLNFEQWEKLKDTFQVMEDFLLELNSSIPCAMQEDHQNQEGALRCSFCNPNDYKNW
jgi:hypothetical protein